MNRLDKEEEDGCTNCLIWTHVHGFRQIGLSGKDICGKVTWSIFLTIMFCFLGLDVYGKITQYMQAMTSTWTAYGYIWDDRKLQYPAMTVCPENPKVPDANANICDAIAIDAEGPFFKNMKTYQTVTDHGMCCTVQVDQHYIKVGMNSSLNVMMYPGLGEGGVYVAFHERKDIPIMGINAQYISKGTDNSAAIKPSRIESGGIACYDDYHFMRGAKSEWWWIERNYTMNNCLYNNMAHLAIKKCGCKGLKECNDQEKWKCVSKILQDPYKHLEEPVYCLEACSRTTFEPMIGSKSNNMLKPKTCQDWLTQVQRECTEDSSRFENQYSGTCSEALSVSCPSEESLADNAQLRKFAKDNLISLKVHYQQYWIETHYTYYVMTTKDLIGQVSVSLAVFFGISFITLAELIFFMFECCTGGKRVQKGEVKRISNPNPPPPPNPTLMNNHGRIQAMQPVSTTVQY